MPLLTVSSIRKQLNASFALQDISLEQEAGKNIAVTGETGSGKSTLLRIIAGLVQPDSGQVLFDGIKVKGPDEQLVPGHPSIAYLSQDHELRNNYRMEELLEYANKLPGQKALSLYKLCRIDHLLQRKNDQLSGGEKQRIALARLLVGSPRLLLLDEPYSNLDIIHKNILKSVIADLGNHLGITCMLTSHDPTDTLSWAEEILVMRNGRVVQRGSPTTIYRQPNDEYTAALFGSYTLVDHETSAALGWGENKGKKLLLRPEAFELNRKGEGIHGVVKSVMFSGGHYEAAIALDGLLIRIRTADQNLWKGEPVHIRLCDASRWWI